MSLMGIQRKRSETRVRSTLAIVFVAMLNLIVQPCSMAMSMKADTDHPCPHCPESAHHDADDEASVAGGIAGCDDVEAYNRDARNGQAGQKNPVDDLSAAVIDLAYFPVPEFSADTPCHGLPPDLDPGGPPLNVLYCVYLN